MKFKGTGWYPAAVTILVLALFWYGLYPAPDGKIIFEREKCIDCHRFKGRGGSIGPDLTAVKSRRSGGWIRDQIRHPEKHNPETRMPSFRHLSRREIGALEKFLKN